MRVYTAEWGGTFEREGKIHKAGERGGGCVRLHFETRKSESKDVACGWNQHLDSRREMEYPSPFHTERYTGEIERGSRPRVGDSHEFKQRTALVRACPTRHKGGRSRARQPRTESNSRFHTPAPAKLVVLKEHQCNESATNPRLGPVYFLAFLGAAFFAGDCAKAAWRNVTGKVSPRKRNIKKRGRGTTKSAGSSSNASHTFLAGALAGEAGAGAAAAAGAAAFLGADFLAAFLVAVFLAAVAFLGADFLAGAAFLAGICHTTHVNRAHNRQFNGSSKKMHYRDAGAAQAPTARSQTRSGRHRRREGGGGGRERERTVDCGGKVPDPKKIV